MSELVNAKGLACPQPVILTKKALETHSEITVLVDNTTAVENVKRFGSANGCSVSVVDEANGIFRIELKKQTSDRSENASREYTPYRAGTPSNITGPTVFVIAADTMGKGSDELGAVLMRAFIHTAIELEHGPDVMIFYNAGVKLTVEGSDLLDDLKQLERKGVKMLICGTCVNYYNLTGQITVGAVSNMYDIADMLSTAGRIVNP